MISSLETFIVNSFTDQPNQGNPAGVCLVVKELDDDQMLSIAKELALSETAFVTANHDSDNYSIRYFSPKMEIPLCGHATLAAAKVLMEKDVKLNEIHFINIQNLDLKVLRKGDAIQMEFPVYDTVPMEVPSALLHALGIDSTNHVAYNKETNIMLLEIQDCQVLRELDPDFEALVKSHNDINGVLVTAASDKDDIDFESRYFWPWSGTNEDPVTGGTHTFLAKYWSERLNKTRMQSFQCSARTGFMEVELISDSKFTILSKARIVIEGKLRM